jgi:integrase
MAKRPRQKHSLVILRDGVYHTNFRINGHRFRQSLRTSDKAEAEIIAAKIRSDALLGKLTGKLPELTVSQALARYYTEHGQYLRSAADMLRWGEELQAGLGKQTLLSDLRAPALATYAARRRLGLANRSVNIELQHLRAVLNRARDVWEAAVAKIDWKKVMLEEAGQREHVLSGDEEERLFAALRPDYHGLVKFALLTGVRLHNVITLSWKQVDKRAGRIKFLVKSKKPGGDLHYVPITAALAELLAGERGHNFERVFTYLCERNRHDRHKGVLRNQGERYPFTRNGWRREWYRALDEAGISDFRFHDLRHTAATRALRAVGNLKTVQRMLGHKDIATTLRYTRSDTDDVRAAMEAVAKAHPAPPRVRLVEGAGGGEDSQ